MGAGKHGSLFDDFKPSRVPDSLPIPDEKGLFGDNPPHVEIQRTVSGAIASQFLTQRMRPTVGGLSCGNARFLAAGTLGAAYKIGFDVFIVSNWHVFYGAGACGGDPILQPGRLDGGVFPDDVIACNAHGTLDNYRDFAAALVPPHLQGQVMQGTYSFGAINGQGQAHPGMLVKKSGRTTDATYGVILSTHAIARVDYHWGSRVFFDQIMLSPMSQPGDSGSILLSTQDDFAVGMIFAGSPAVSFANKGEYIFPLLDSNSGAEPMEIDFDWSA